MNDCIAWKIRADRYSTDNQTWKIGKIINNFIGI